MIPGVTQAAYCAGAQSACGTSNDSYPPPPCPVSTATTEVNEQMSTSGQLSYIESIVNMPFGTTPSLSNPGYVSLPVHTNNACNCGVESSINAVHLSNFSASWSKSSESEVSVTGSKTRNGIVVASATSKATQAVFNFSGGEWSYTYGTNCNCSDVSYIFGECNLYNLISEGSVSGGQTITNVYTPGTRPAFIQASFTLRWVPRSQINVTGFQISLTAAAAAIGPWTVSTGSGLTITNGSISYSYSADTKLDLVPNTTYFTTFRPIGVSSQAELQDLKSKSMVVYGQDTVCFLIIEKGEILSPVGVVGISNHIFKQEAVQLGGYSEDEAGALAFLNASVSPKYPQNLPPNFWTGQGCPYGSRAPGSCNYSNGPGFIFPIGADTFGTGPAFLTPWSFTGGVSSVTSVFQYPTQQTTFNIGLGPPQPFGTPCPPELQDGYVPGILTCGIFDDPFQCECSYYTGDTANPDIVEVFATLVVSGGEIPCPFDPTIVSCYQATVPTRNGCCQIGSIGAIVDSAYQIVSVQGNIRCWGAGSTTTEVENGSLSVTLTKSLSGNFSIS